MEFETVKIGDSIHVSINGVISAAFAREHRGGGWVVFVPRIAHMPAPLENALALIAADMDDWHTAKQAAERLMELGAYDSPPSVHTMSNLARAGAFPGAFKLLGGGGHGGQGGAWRIPEAGIIKFVKRREGQ